MPTDDELAAVRPPMPGHAPTCPAVCLACTEADLARIPSQLNVWDIYAEVIERYRR